MSGSTENASATIAAVQTSPGVYQYTVTLTDTGSTPVGTFWFAWDDVPSQDFMTAMPSDVGAPTGWSAQVTTQTYPGGTGYGIEWTAGTAGAAIPEGGTSAAFSFTSTETPAQMAAQSPLQMDGSTFQTTSSFVYAGAPFVTPGGNFVVASAATGAGLLGGLNIGQQLELIYIAYFNRAADSGGNTFWVDQNAQAQGVGQSAAVALSNIANAFEPQPETLALYPFLGTANLDLTSAAGQSGLNAFINSVYQNLFGHQADQGGAAYWVGQVSGGAVGLGAAALAIANGATGTDAITLQNKISVALDFILATETAGIGTSGPLPMAFLNAAQSVLSGVDGIALNDASVSAGEAAVTAFVNGGTSAATTIPVTHPVTHMVVGTANGMSFLPGAEPATLLPNDGGTNETPGLAALLTGAPVNPTDSITPPSGFVTTPDSGGAVMASFDPSAAGTTGLSLGLVMRAASLSASNL